MSSCLYVVSAKESSPFDRVLFDGTIENVHNMELIPKTIGNRKKLCVRLRSGDKHHLRKSADRKAQTSPVSGTNAFLICAFRSADFLRWCLSPERSLTHNLSFISNSFWY